MNYLSVCSGIEAATVAWHSLGWNPVAFSEIEKFPSQVLKHHYPNVPNVGDMTKFKEWNLGSTVNLLVGGTPCQSFSVAGLRKGLDDPRGNLMLTYLAIADKYRPRWLVWENVPGVLSSNGGKDFGTFLGGLGELGYGFAYRILDAQYFGVAQRRRRVFVIGYFGDWRPAAAVLFERHSLQGNPSPSREKGKRTASFFESSLAQYRADDVGGTLKASGGVLGGGSETFLAQRLVYEMHGQDNRVRELGNVCTTISPTYGTGGGNVPVTLQPIGTELYATTLNWPAEVASALNASFGSKLGLENQHINEGAPLFVPTTTAYSIQEDAQANTFSATELAFVARQMEAIPIDTMNHIGRKDDHSLGDFEPGAPSYTLTKGHSHAVAQPIPYDLHQVTAPVNKQNRSSGDPCHTLAKENAHNAGIVQEKIRINVDQEFDDSIIAPSLTTNDPSRSPQASEVTQQINAVYQSSMAVRRLTPVECERLQGFPDNYTKINDKSADGPRYKALGNSMAVPVMHWIGLRIEMYENEFGLFK